jgi:hypothetical protein
MRTVSDRWTDRIDTPGFGDHARIFAGQPPGKWTPDIQALFNSTMLELGVLGGLIMIMVISICLLRYSERIAVDK